MEDTGPIHSVLQAGRRSGMMGNPLNRYNSQILEIQDLAYTLAYDLCGNDEQAGELVQTACLDAYQNPQSGNFWQMHWWPPRSHPVLTQVLRCVIRGWKQSAALRSRPSDRQTAGRELHQRMGQNMNETEYQTALLVDVLGLTYEEAADVLSCSRREILQHIASARRKMIVIS
jgi:DNA-directed RNA polymerase specialized sigma24 family protein